NVGDAGLEWLVRGSQLPELSARPEIVGGCLERLGRCTEHFRGQANPGTVENGIEKVCTAVNLAEDGVRPDLHPVEGEDRWPASVDLVKRLANEAGRGAVDN